MPLEGRDGCTSANAVGAGRVGVAYRQTPPVAWATAVLVFVLGLTSSVMIRDLEQRRSDQELSAELSAASVRFVGEMNNAVAQLEDVARSSIVGTAPRGLTTLTRQGERFIARGGGQLLPEDAELAAYPILADVASQVRDTGKTHIAVAQLPGEVRPRAMVMIPLFGSRTPPATTAARRSQLTAISLADLQVSLIAATAFENVRGLVSVHDGSFVLFGDPETRLPAGRTDVPLRERVWTLTAIPLASPATTLPWAISLLALLLALTIIGTLTRRSMRTNAAEAQTSATLGKSQIITHIGALLQTTPDVSETLPSLAVYVVDAFELEAFVVTAPGANNTPENLFVFGAPVDGSGQRDVSFPLIRAGRTVGALTVRPKPDAPDVAPTNPSLTAIAGLLSAAMGNARAFEAERTMVERLRGVDQMKTEFLATMSHEIRTPLVSIAGFSALLVESWDTVDRSVIKDYATRIDRNAMSLSRLLQQLLNFSRLERGKLSVTLSEFDLATAVRDILDRDSLMLEHHRLKATIPRDLVVLSDPAAIEQIASNLLSNAVKFAPTGSRIGVSLDVDGDDAVLVVEDDGPGIAPAERERVFSRFYRGSSDAALRTRGAGIGLAVVAELTTTLHGSVSVGDSPSGGARFVVRLPRGTVTPEEPTRAEQHTTIGD